MDQQKVKLSELHSSHINPRQIFHDSSLLELAENILKYGVIQSITVKGIEEGYSIIAGERRFKACHILLERGDIQDTYEIPVVIMEPESEEEERLIALMENLMRENMHPMDESDAYYTLTGEGVQVEELAAKSGLSIKAIKDRLLLQNLSKASRTAYRKEVIPSFSMAVALSMGNHSEQKEALKCIKKGHLSSADGIRRFMLTEKPNVAIARFPIEEYKGTFTKDLFATEENTYFDDREQFFTQQAKAVETMINEFEKNADWVELIEGYGYGFERWKYEDAIEGEIGGVLIIYKPDGNVVIHEGLVKRKKVKADKGTPREKPEFTQKAYQYIADHKTLALQASLHSGAFRKVKEIDLLQRLTETFGVNVKQHRAIKWLNAEETPSPAVTFLRNCLQELEQKLHIVFHYDYECFGVNEETLFTSIKVLSDDELDHCLTLVVAISFGQSERFSDESKESIFHEIGRDLELDVRQWWIPDATFFNLQRKEQLLTIARQCGASKGKDFGHLKKKELVDELVSYFANPEPLKNTAQEEQRGTYCPAPMQFALPKVKAA